MNSYIRCLNNNNKNYATIAKIPFHGEESLDSVIKTLILNATVEFTLRSKKFDVPVI